MLEFSRSRAIERAALAQLLRTVGEGETVTYAELDRAAGTGVRAERHLLTAARREVRDEDGLVFEPLNLVGLRRLTQVEMATVQPDRRRQRAFRQSVIAQREMAGVREADLGAGERVQFLARLAQHGALAAIATHRATAKLAGIIAVDNPVLTVDQTLTMLREIR